VARRRFLGSVIGAHDIGAGDAVLTREPAGASGLAMSRIICCLSMVTAIFGSLTTSVVPAAAAVWSARRRDEHCALPTSANEAPFVASLRTDPPLLVVGEPATITIVMSASAGTTQVGPRFLPQAGSAGPEHRLRAVGHLQLVQDVADVVSDRLGAEYQAGSDVGIRLASKRS
jgi:hypothetical protein